MYRLMRTGHNVKARIRKQLQRALRQRTIARRGKFLWPLQQDSVKPRRPARGVKLRDIDQVPPEELEAAALLVTRLTKGIIEGELSQETARVLGYPRITDNIRNAASKAIARLLKAGILVARGDHVVVE